MAPPRQSSTKERSRQERNDELEDEQDVDLKPPTSKKRNTKKAPSLINPKRSHTADSPLEASASKRRRTTGSPPPPAARAAAPTPSKRGRSGSKHSTTIMAQEESAELRNNASHQDDSDDDEDIGRPPPLPSRQGSVKNATRTTRVPSPQSPVKDASSGNEQDNIDTTAMDSENYEGGVVDGGGVELEDEDDKSPLSQLFPNFQKPTRQELGLLLLVVIVIVFIAVLLLSTALAVFDTTDSTLAVHSCRLQVQSGDNPYAAFDNNINQQGDFVQQEKEKQLQYWKRLAKQNEAFAEGYKEEYQAALQQLEG